MFRLSRNLEKCHGTTQQLPSDHRAPGTEPGESGRLRLAHPISVSFRRTSKNSGVYPSMLWGDQSHATMIHAPGHLLLHEANEMSAHQGKMMAFIGRPPGAAKDPAPACASQRLSPGSGTHGRVQSRISRRSRSTYYAIETNGDNPWTPGGQWWRPLSAVPGPKPPRRSQMPLLTSLHTQDPAITP